MLTNGEKTDISKVNKRKRKKKTEREDGPPRTQPNYPAKTKKAKVWTQENVTKYPKAKQKNKKTKKQKNKKRKDSVQCTVLTYESHPKMEK